MKYCQSCQQNVEPIKKFSIGWFLFNCLTIVGGGVYIIYYLFFKSKVCPICNGNQLITKITDNNGETILVTQESTTDKTVNWLSNNNKKMEEFNAKLQKKNEEITAKRELKKKLKQVNL